MDKETERIVSPVQASESRRVGALLAMAGGGMNAYSWLLRGGVFATMMTGNLLYFTFNLVQQKWEMLPHYFMPILCFFIGIVIADYFHFHDARHRYHWRQGSSVLIAVLLVASSFFSKEMSFFSALLISFTGGLQAETYTRIQGQVVATTMGTGNFKNIAHWIALYLHTKAPDSLQKSWLYLRTNLYFTFGAIVEGLLTLAFGFWAILFVAFLHLLISWWMRTERVTTLDVNIS